MGSDPKGQWAEIRAALDKADDALVQALDLRARVVKEFLSLREQDPDNFYTTPNLAEVMARVKDAVVDFPRPSLEPVMREILSACDALIRPVRVGFIGAAGGLPHLAASRHFGSSADFQSFDTAPALVAEIARGEISFGVVPLETSTDGAVTATLDALAHSDAKICAEITIPSAYHLVSRTGNASDIEKIYGAPAAHAACDRTLRKAFPKASVLDVPSGAIAAQFASDDHGAAAISTELMVATHNFKVVLQDIQDRSGVHVRYAIVGTELPRRTGTDRTILAVAVNDSPGALYKALRPFADRGVNLTRLESRPAHGETWRYLFFIELDGHVTDRTVLTAIADLRDAARWSKILGSYPRPPQEGPSK
ncbi:MAG: ACT domain-containing protein [Sandaracinaceae bacterium]|nr:ACT domain-containing protein [Sandaracinaceae bacterium]